MAIKHFVEEPKEDKREIALKVAKEIQSMLSQIKYKGTSHLYEQTRNQVIEPVRVKLDLLIKNLS